MQRELYATRRDSSRPQSRGGRYASSGGIATVTLPERSLHAEPDHDAPDNQWLVDRMHRKAEAARAIIVRGEQRDLTLHECPNCDALSEQPGKCWRCYL